MGVNDKGNFSGRSKWVRPLGDVCSVAMWDHLMIRSGNANEFYATEWEIWFEPSEGAESTCVGKQEFLLMGG